MLKVIDGSKDRIEKQLQEKRMRALNIKQRAYLHALNKGLNALTPLWDRKEEVRKRKDVLIPTIIGGVKLFDVWNRMYHGIRHFEGGGYEAMQKLSIVYDSIILLLAQLSPEEIAVHFPPTKDFDGHKYEMKDYFSSKYAIEHAGGSKVLGDEDAALNFVYEYQNKDLDRFAITGILLVDAIRDLQGQPSVMEEFIKDQKERESHIPKLYHTCKGSDGTELFFDEKGNYLGKAEKKKRRPSWIKLAR